MENYNYHRTGTNYYLEDKRKSVKKKNQFFVSFGINRSKHSSRLHFSKLCKKVTERLSRFRHRSVVSKITRKQTRCTDKIQTLSRFWRFTNRISFDKTANVSISSRSNRPPLYEDFMNDVERHGVRLNLPNTTANFE